jgi:hypothetical protein
LHESLTLTLVQNLCVVAMVGATPEPPLSFDAEVTAFNQLIKSLGNPSVHPTHTQFVKKLDSIPKFVIPKFARTKALSYASKGIIGQFTGLWPYPRQVDL